MCGPWLHGYLCASVYSLCASVTCEWTMSVCSRLSAVELGPICSYALGCEHSKTLWAGWTHWAVNSGRHCHNDYCIVYVQYISTYIYIYIYVCNYIYIYTCIYMYVCTTRAAMQQSHLFSTMLIWMAMWASLVDLQGACWPVAMRLYGHVGFACWFAVVLVDLWRCAFFISRPDQRLSGKPGGSWPWALGQTYAEG